MKLNYQVILSTLALLVIDGAAHFDIAINLQFESLKWFIIQVNFDKNSFQQFYSCLCGEDHVECQIKYTGNQTPFSSSEIKAVNRSSPAHQPFSNYYKCENKGSSKTVICKRLAQAGNWCSGKLTFTTVPPVQAESFHTACVGILWDDPSVEFLKYNGTKLNSTGCQSSCYKPSEKTVKTTATAQKTTTKPPSSVVTQSVFLQGKATAGFGTPASMNTSNENYLNGNEEKQSDGISLPAIVGIVFGVVLAIILASVTAGLLWRRKRRTAKRAGEYDESATPGHSSNPRNTRAIDDYEEVDLEPSSVLFPGYENALNTYSLAAVVQDDINKTEHEQNMGSSLTTHTNGNSKSNPLERAGMGLNQTPLPLSSPELYPSTSRKSLINSMGQPNDPLYNTADVSENGGHFYPQKKSDQKNEGLDTKAESDLPEYAVVNKNRQRKQTPSTEYPIAENDMPEYAVVNKAGKDKGNLPEAEDVETSTIQNPDYINSI